MDLVWRDQAVSESAAPSTAGDELLHQGPEKTAFKFVRGRSKKKRKPKMLHQGLGDGEEMESSATAFTTQPTSCHGKEPSSEIEHWEPSAAASTDTPTPDHDESAPYQGAQEAETGMSIF